MHIINTRKLQNVKYKCEKKDIKLDTCRQNKYAIKKKKKKTNLYIY